MNTDQAMEIIKQIIEPYGITNAREVAYQIIAALQDAVHGENMPDLSPPAPDQYGNPRFGCG